MPHRTAIKRKSPSLPIIKLQSAGLLVGRSLDYGCGYGMDADTFNMERWDPYYSPARPKGLFDIITCTYVLCVLPKVDEQEILGDVSNLLKPSGKGYITVRNDILEDSITKIGTTRRIVGLELPLFYKCADFKIYEVRKK
jgi:ATP adenylyltransferase